MDINQILSTFRIWLFLVLFLKVWFKKVKRMFLDIFRIQYLKLGLVLKPTNSLHEVLSTLSDSRTVQFSHCVWMKTMQCIWNFLRNTCTYFFIFCRLAILSNNHHISGSRIPHIFGLEKKRHVLLTAQLTKPNENQKVAFGPDVCADYK